MVLYVRSSEMFSFFCCFLPSTWCVLYMLLLWSVLYMLLQIISTVIYYVILYKWMVWNNILLYTYRLVKKKRMMLNPKRKRRRVKNLLPRMEHHPQKQLNQLLRWHTFLFYLFFKMKYCSNFLWYSRSSQVSFWNFNSLFWLCYTGGSVWSQERQSCCLSCLGDGSWRRRWWCWGWR